ncbi:hypothetical protein ANN_05774 [Periplaneta americana]|uniref:Reverse transcriptase Ty1/copia-type domain-containing protein n=1 Tax=Periplaneta americana TaxID=6978 RepID=A0ABQ8TE72_PERAM|nr:hypothetical protein ANN_05774 [Periplaneta americana]
MAGLCEGGNEPPDSLKARDRDVGWGRISAYGYTIETRDLLTGLAEQQFELIAQMMYLVYVAPAYLSRNSIAFKEEMMLRDMLLELNDSCELYGMKINANKTKAILIGRKLKKVNLLIRNEAVEQVDSFK